MFLMGMDSGQPWCRGKSGKTEDQVILGMSS